MKIDSVKWTNCFADIASSKHGRSVEMYMREVVAPSLTSLQSQIAVLKESTDESVVFVLDDVENLLDATIKAYCLSLQSLWERQLRDYLIGCVENLRKDGALARKLTHCHWDELLTHFKDLRGVSLESFDSFSLLYLLQHIGNACRHGDGSSARKLYGLHAEWWPHWSHDIPAEISDTKVVTSPPSKPPSFKYALIPASMLTSLANAIIWFWEDAHFIYINSLSRKHPSAIRNMDEIRTARETRNWLTVTAK